MHTVPHVSQGAHGDADGFVLVLESWMFQHGVHVVRCSEQKGRDVEEQSCPLLEGHANYGIFHVKTHYPTRLTLVTVFSGIQVHKPRGALALPGPVSVSRLQRRACRVCLRRRRAGQRPTSVLTKPGRPKLTSRSRFSDTR